MGDRAASAAAALAAIAAVLLSAGSAAAAQPDGFAPRSIGPGAWSYFGDPRAIHARGVTYVGWADPRGYTHVAALRGRRMVAHRRLGPRLTIDDHNNPSLYLRPDGRIVVFYSAHNGDRMYYRTSKRPYSIASLSAPRVIPTNTRGPWGFTYPNPLRADGRLWLMFRGADWQPTFTIATPRGWTRARTLVRGPVATRATRAPLGPGDRHRPYAKYDSDGERIHAVFTDGNLGAYPNTIRYAQIDANGIRTADGRLVAPLGHAPPIGRLDLVRAYRGRSQWALDIAVGEDGMPVIVYQRRARRAEYWYARYDGTRWRNHLITRYSRRARSPGAVGGITLDHETPNIVYLARTARGTKAHEVEVWATPDNGLHWTRRAITRTPNVDDLRPVSPRGLQDFEQVIWFAGRRTFWTSFDTRVLLEIVRRALRAAHR